MIGKKLGMTRLFSSDGDALPVTVLQVGPCAVVQKKTVARDGYAALQLGFQEVKATKLNKAQQGHMKHFGEQAYAVLKEFRTDSAQHEVGAQLTVDMFEPGDQVHITGMTKGKGFAGNIKRWGFHRGPMKHGSKFHRGVGGVSGSAYPGKVFKGKKMPGRLGNERVTVKRLLVLDSRPEENLLLVRGAVPGRKNGIVIIQKAAQ